jgi:hypothetical protein
MAEAESEGEMQAAVEDLAALIRGRAAAMATRKIEAAE